MTKHEQFSEMVLEMYRPEIVDIFFEGHNDFTVLEITKLLGMQT